MDSSSVTSLILHEITRSPQTDTRPHRMTPDSDRIVRTSLTNDFKDVQNIVNHSANTWLARRISVTSIIQCDDMISKAGHHPIMIRSVIRRSKYSNRILHWTLVERYLVPSWPCKYMMIGWSSDWMYRRRCSPSVGSWRSISTFDGTTYLDECLRRLLRSQRLTKVQRWHSVLFVRRDWFRSVRMSTVQSSQSKDSIVLKGERSFSSSSDEWRGSSYTNSGRITWWESHRHRDEGGRVRRRSANRRERQVQYNIVSRSVVHWTTSLSSQSRFVHLLRVRLVVVFVAAMSSIWKKSDDKLNDLENRIGKIKRLVVANDKIIDTFVNFEFLRRAVIEKADLENLSEILHSSNHSNVTECVTEKNDIRSSEYRLKVRRAVNLLFVLVERMNDVILEGDQLALVVVSNEIRDDMRRMVIVFERRDFFLEKVFDHIA